MVRPFRTYRELTEDGEDRGNFRSIAFRVLLLLLVIGAFVSFTTAGRLVAFHVANSMVFWSFVPALQTAALVIAVRAVAPRTSLGSAVALHFVGHGPWLLFMLVVSGICLFAPHVYFTFTWLITHGVLPLYLLGTLGWSAVITTAYFRVGLSLSRGRTALGTFLYYLIYIGVIAAWYFATNQLPPQVFGVP